jgi:hypothetical protein
LNPVENGRRTVSEQSRNGFYLHASAVLIPEGALLFLGHSTSGKTTISKKMSGRYSVLADDVVFIQERGNGLYCIDDGKKRLSRAEPCLQMETAFENMCYPVSAIVRIFKGNPVKAERITSLQLCRYLTDALFEVDVQRRSTCIDYRKNLFINAAALAKKTTGRHLWFDLDSDPETIVNALRRCPDNSEETTP